MQTIIDTLLGRSRSLLVLDDDTSTSNIRFGNVGLPQDDLAARLEFRRALCSTPDLAKFVGGVIFADETLYAQFAEGVTFASYLESRDIMPGISLDLGMSSNTHDKHMRGLDSAEDRLARAAEEAHVRYAKFRYLYRVGESRQNMAFNVMLLAKFASICLTRNVLPIVEIDLSPQGSHDIINCLFTTGEALKILFEVLATFELDPKEILLKLNMITSGISARNQSTSSDVARDTTQVRLVRIPQNIGGVLYVSGGLSPDIATSYLGEVCAANTSETILRAAMSSAMQLEPLQVWAQSGKNIDATQRALLNRLEAIQKAVQKR